MDGTTRLSRDGEPVYHYSFLSTFAEACVVPERSCVPIPDDVPFDVAALVGCAVTTGVGAVWRTAGVRPGDRVAVIGCGGVGLSALMAAVAVGAEPVDRGRRRGRRSSTSRGAFGATDGVALAGSAEATAEAVREASGGGVDYAIEATGRPEAMLAAFLSTRARGAAVLIGIPRADAVLSLPARRSRAWSGACSARSTARRGPSGTSRRRSSSTAAGGFRSTGSSRTGCRSTRSSAAFELMQLRRGAARRPRPERSGMNLDDLDGRIGEGWGGEAPNGEPRQRRARAARQPDRGRRDLDARAPRARPHAGARLRRADAAGVRARLAADADDEQGDRARGRATRR